MNRSNGWALVVTVVFIFVVQGQGSASALSKVNQAQKISDAFRKGRAQEWRLTTLEEIQSFRRMSAKELVKTLELYRKIVVKRGSQGVEAVMAVAAAELGSRGKTGRELVRRHLVLLEKIYKFATAIQRPNAYVPMVKPNSPVVHFIPTQIARSIFTAQIKNKSVDIDAALAHDLCSEQALTEYEVRFGRKKAEILRKLCQGINNAPSQGGKGPGFLAGLSVVDCLMATQERPRADVFSEMAQNCAASITAQGGNPFTLSSTSRFENTVTWNLDSRQAFRIRATDNRVIDPDRTKTHSTDPDDPSRVDTKTTFDRSGVIVTREIYTDGKLTSITWFDEFGDMTEKMEVSGNETTHSFYGEHNELLSRDVTRTDENGVDHAARSEVYENGVISESVDFNDDGGYTVKRYDENGNVNYEQRYDEDGKPVNADGSSAAGSNGSGASMPGGDGDVTAECRKMELELIRERIEGDLRRGGRDRLDPKVINPNPQEWHAPLPDDLKCLGMRDMDVDVSMKCNELVQCPLNELPNESCSCSPLRGATLPDRQCGFIITCADGSQPKAENGQCSCEDVEEIFADPLSGGGPVPVDHFSVSGR